jgi:hypothetical protein
MMVGSFVQFEGSTILATELVDILSTLVETEPNTKVTVRDDTLWLVLDYPDQETLF